MIAGLIDKGQSGKDRCEPERDEVSQIVQLGGRKITNCASIVNGTSRGGRGKGEGENPGQAKPGSGKVRWEGAKGRRGGETFFKFCS